MPRHIEAVSPGRDLTGPCSKGRATHRRYICPLLHAHTSLTQLCRSAFGLLLRPPSYHFSKQHTDSTILWLGRPPLGCRRRQNVPPLPQQKARWQMCPWPLLRPLEQRPRRNKRPKKCSKLLPRYWRSARTQSKMQRMPFRSQRVAPPGAGKACIVKSCIVLLHCC